MTVPNRNYSSPSYRYGFQGQEKDDEIKGNGNSYTATFWQYDSRLGKRWNIDPVVKSHESPYASFSNNPIFNIDPNGDDSDGHDSKDDKFYGTDGKLLHDDGVGNKDFIVSEKDYCKAVNDIGKDYPLDISEALRGNAQQAFTSSDGAVKSWSNYGYSLTRKDNLERAAAIFKGTVEGGRDLYVVGSTVKGNKSKDVRVTQEVNPFKSEAIVGDLNLLDEKYYTYNWVNVKKYTTQMPLAVTFGWMDNPIVSRFQQKTTNNVWNISGVTHTHYRGNDRFSATVKGGLFSSSQPIGGDIGLSIDGYDVYLIPTTYSENNYFFVLRAHSISGSGYSSAQELENDVDKGNGKEKISMKPVKK